MDGGKSQPGGLLAGLRRMADSLLSLAQNRIELFSLELESEKLRLLETLIKLAVALSVGLVGVALGTLTLALYVWELARYRGLIVMTLLLLAGATFLLWRLRRELQQLPRPFSKTIAEFEKDRSCLPKQD